MAKFDLYLTHLGYSLDDRLWDVELAKVWELTSLKNRKKLSPDLTTKKKLAALLNIPAQRLSSPGKIKSRSKQKTFLGQPAFFPSSDNKFPHDQLGELNKLRKKAQSENNFTDIIYLDNEIAKLKRRLPGNK